MKFLLVPGTLVVCLSVPVAASAQAPPAANPIFTELSRTFSDNSAWQLSTSAGIGRLSRVFSDGSRWEFTIPGHRYEISRTFSDNSTWSIAEGSQTLRFTTVFSKDLGRWSIGGVRFDATFSDFKTWSAPGFQVRSQFSDCSRWSIADDGRLTDPAQKCAMLLAAVVAATSSPAK